MSITRSRKRHRPLSEKKVVRREEFVVDEPSEHTTAARQIIDTTAREVGDSEDEDFESDPLDDFFAELEEEQGYSLYIERLLTHNANGRTDSRAAKEYVDTIPFDRSSPYTYLKTIQELYGGGTYRFTLRGKGRFTKQWVKTIAHKLTALSNQAGQGQIILQQPTPTQPAQPPIDPLDQLVQMAEKYAKIQKSFSAFGPTQPQQQANPSQIQQAEKPLEEKIFEKLLGLAEKNEPLADRLLDKYLGNPEPKETSWTADLVELVKELGKPLVPLIAGLIARQMQSPPPAPYPQQPPGQLPAAPPQHEPGATDPYQTSQGPGAVFESQEPEEDEPLMNLLDKLVKEVAQLAQQQANEIAVQAAAERGAGWVKEFKEEFPAASMFIAGLIHGTPVDVLKALESFSEDYQGISNIPVATLFVEKLQAALRGNQ